MEDLPFDLTADEELLCGCDRPRPDAADRERVRRITDEITTAFAALAGVTKAVSVFGSACAWTTSPEYALGREVAAALGRCGFAVMTGGGPGLMEAANRGAREVGVASIGLSIELPSEQVTNEFVDTAIRFRYFFARRLMFVRYASAFVVLPGGFGTMDELFEALTLVQTGKVRNFPVVLVGTEHWRGLIDWVQDRLLGFGRIDAAALALLHVTDDVDEVCEIVTRHHVAQFDERARHR